MACQMHPVDATARKRLADSKLLFTEGRLAAARIAAAEGRAADAVAEYRRAIEIVPEVAGLRLELAALLLAAGDLDGAAGSLEGDPTLDPQVLLRLGELRMRLNRYGDAVEAYQKAHERDPANVGIAQRLVEAQRALEFSRMPEEYQRIFTAPFITRADLAALIDVKVGSLSRLGPGEPQVAVDVSGSWAKDHILHVLALGIMEVYPNHTFQPAALVRRGDLANAVARVLDGLRHPRIAGPAITDMNSTHLYYEAAARVVGAGLLELTPEGAFEPGLRVSGRQAADAVEGLGRLIAP
jgi:hypothetical protein